MQAGTTAILFEVPLAPSPSAPILPTISASLLLSFVFSCLACYRAHLLGRVETSRVNLLCEVFANEADSFMLPSFRNLLHGESVFLIPTFAT